jgi:hypothetical protein
MATFLKSRYQAERDALWTARFEQADDADPKRRRRTILLYLKPEIIKQLKKAALDKVGHAHEIAE